MKLLFLVKTLSGVSFLTFIIGPLLSHYEILTPFQGFKLFGCGLLMCLLAFIGLCVVGIWLHNLRQILLYAVLSLVPIILAVVFLVQARKFPPINDITTDLDNVPQFRQAQNLPENKARDLRYPEAFRQIARASYADLKPFVSRLTPQELYARCLVIIKRHDDWTLTVSDPENLAIEGYVTSFTFHFKDDFVIKIQDSSGYGWLNMRSKSRDGKGDLGANAKRIRAFLSELSSE